MGNRPVVKSLAKSGLSVLHCIGKIRYTTDFYGVSSTPIDNELIAHLASDTNNAVVDQLLSDVASPTCVFSLLAITVNFGTLIVADVTNIVADPSDAKTILVTSYCDDITGDPEVVVFEKTTGQGEYGSPPAGKTFGSDLKEYTLVAAGTALVEINDFI